jgi:hypothetical protein
VGRFHAAGAGSFIRRQRPVEPDIHVGRQQLRQLQIVVRQVRQLDLGLQCPALSDNLLDQCLAALVFGMGLASEHELQGAVPLRDAAQLLGAVEQQVWTLVSRGSAGKVQREHILIEPGVDPAIHLFDWTLCPIEGPCVPAVPQVARALTRPAIRSRSIVPLAGHVSVNIRHWHTICFLPEMSGACAYKVCEMAGESRVGPGLEGGISPCGVSVFTAAAARG